MSAVDGLRLSGGANLEHGVRWVRIDLSADDCIYWTNCMDWRGSLGPAGPGNRCTPSASWTRGDPGPRLGDRLGVLDALWRQLRLDALGLDADRIQHWRGWASSTPAGVPIALHAHDGDQVVAIYLQVPENPEPLEFVLPGDGHEAYWPYWPEPGMVLTWPSSLAHRVPEGPRRAGERVVVAWNLTLRGGA